MVLFPEMSHGIASDPKRNRIENIVNLTYISRQFVTPLYRYGYAPQTERTYS